MTNDLINEHSILDDEKYLEEDGSQNYLIFKPVYKYLQMFLSSDKLFA